jgi:hypothetical protein
MSPVNVPYIENAKPINVSIFYVESNPLENRLAKQPIGKPGKRLNADLKEMLM